MSAKFPRGGGGAGPFLARSLIRKPRPSSQFLSVEASDDTMLTSGYRNISQSGSNFDNVFFLSFV